MFTSVFKSFLDRFFKLLISIFLVVNIISVKSISFYKIPLGSTWSPIKVEKTTVAASSSVIFTCTRLLVSGFIVVSHSLSDSSPLALYNAERLPLSLKNP